MKRLALILLASCSAQAPDDYPIQPGGGGGVIPPIQSDAGMVKGRACLVTDARDLTSCATTGAEGLAVQLGDETVMTEADGGFSIPAPDGSSPSLAMLGITGNGVVPTQVAVPDGTGQGAMSIPLLKADLFAQMMAANGITPSSGSGSIIGSVARGGSPVSGVSVSSTPSSAFDPRFDGGTPTAWTLDGTGARGVVWIPGVAAGPTSLTFRDLATSGETTVDGVQVINGGITIMDAVLP